MPKLQDPMAAIRNCKQCIHFDPLENKNNYAMRGICNYHVLRSGHPVLVQIAWGDNSIPDECPLENA